ncbi:MAG: hypothetical protein JNJ49_04510 [Bdellovibrionaceae bacterium]|nr:hypothetical protein [Pseudobdellovibrionaceae bacterium]
MLSRFQIQIFSVAVLFLCLQPNAVAAPNDGLVQQELIGKDYYDFMAGQILINPGLPIKEVKTKTGQAVGTTVGKDSAIAQFAKDESIPGGIWRLTEVHFTKGRFNASSTTFYSSGVRAKTFCDGDSGETTQCVTATRKFCEEFKKRARATGLDSKDAAAKGKFLELGQQCSTYANFLNTTIDPNKMLTDSQRVQRDDDVLSSDLDAMKALKEMSPEKSVRDLKLKGFGDHWGREDAVGASSSGMKNRFDRMKDIGRDFMSLSRLATMCSDIQFGTENGISETGGGGSGRGQKVRK